MKILIGGDFAPSEYNEELFIRGDGEQLYTNELLEFINQFDYRIYDFESVIGGYGEKINKSGPYMITTAATFPGIALVKPDVMVLANNHINNLGEKGIKHTIDFFTEHHIKTVGAGLSLEEAKKPIYLEKDNCKVGILAVGENEFNLANNNTAGISPVNSFDIQERIVKAKNECDVLIILYHGGRIEYRYPLPNEQRRLRSFVDYGADIVVGQHTHTIGSKEEYKGKTIIYGQGDFLFARPSLNDHRESGLLLCLDIHKESISIEYEVRIKPKHTIRLATADEKNTVLNAFDERSSRISNIEFVKESFEKYCQIKELEYLRVLLGSKRRNLFFRGLDKLSNHKFTSYYFEHLFKKQDILSLVNFIKCESHNEILCNILDKKVK